jgi:hypothetical protein
MFIGDYDVTREALARNSVMVQLRHHVIDDRVTDSAGSRRNVMTEFPCKFYLLRGRFA